MEQHGEGRTAQCHHLHGVRPELQPWRELLLQEDVAFCAWAPADKKAADEGARQAHWQAALVLPCAPTLPEPSSDHRLFLLTLMCLLAFLQIAVHVAAVRLAAPVEKTLHTLLHPDIVCRSVVLVEVEAGA